MSKGLAFTSELVITQYDEKDQSAEKFRKDIIHKQIILSSALKKEVSNQLERKGKFRLQPTSLLSSITTITIRLFKLLHIHLLYPPFWRLENKEFSKVSTLRYLTYLHFMVFGPIFNNRELKHTCIYNILYNIIVLRHNSLFYQSGN